MAPCTDSGASDVEGAGPHRSARGRTVAFALLYSLDFNPIEEAFEKVKGLLRKAAARSGEALVEAMGAVLAAVGIPDARGFFEHCGYYHPAQLL